VADRRQVALRVGFLALLAGGLLLWSRARMPRDVSVVIDLTGALPGELSEVDVVVTRSGRALARVDRRFALGTAPQQVRVQLRAPPGTAEVDATLIYPGRAAHRTQGEVMLEEEKSATLIAR
jgi:hypothetical protein